MSRQSSRSPRARNLFLALIALGLPLFASGEGYGLITSLEARAFTSLVSGTLLPCFVFSNIFVRHHPNARISSRNAACHNADMENIPLHHTQLRALPFLSPCQATYSCTAKDASLLQAVPATGSHLSSTKASTFLQHHTVNPKRNYVTCIVACKEEKTSLLF